MEPVTVKAWMIVPVFRMQYTPPILGFASEDEAKRVGITLQKHGVIGDRWFVLDYETIVGVANPPGK